MFPLAGNIVPTSIETLASSIEASLAKWFAVPEGGGVRICGGTFPALGEMTINLDGAAVRTTRAPLQSPAVTGSGEGGFTVEMLAVSARPVVYQQAKLNLMMSGTGFTFGLGRDQGQNLQLVLTGAENGTVQASISRLDLQAMLLAAASTFAKEHGIAIADLHVDLASEGPRSVTATVRVKAKKMMMSGVIVITGRADLDDEFNATISRLGCSGEGMIGAAAAAILQNKITPFDGMKIALVTFSPGEIKLRDMKLDLSNDVKISAAFGNGQ